MTRGIRSWVPVSAISVRERTGRPQLPTRHWLEQEGGRAMPPTLSHHDARLLQLLHRALCLVEVGSEVGGVVLHAHDRLTLLAELLERLHADLFSLRRLDVGRPQAVPALLQRVGHRHRPRPLLLGEKEPVGAAAAASAEEVVLARLLQLLGKSLQLSSQDLLLLGEPRLVGGGRAPRLQLQGLEVVVRLLQVPESGRADGGALVLGRRAHLPQLLSSLRGEGATLADGLSKHLC
mmetsp:Transcript_117457/g.365805  ORF Transcript_117457/g.365805 Transcript_117457/m.365805 type:complete len:235 (+) Transcript_117457:427-1131(+)